MNDLRTRAQRIKEKGESERGNFEPTGAPLRMYRYWARRSNNVPARENFCHYWRVVMLWAPLMWTKNKAESFAMSTTGMATIFLTALALVVWGCIASGEVLVFMLALLGGLWTIFGALSGAVLGDRTDYYDSGDKKIAAVGTVVSFPAALLAYVVVRVVQGWPQEWYGSTKMFFKNLAIGLLTLAVFALIGWFFWATGWFGFFLALGVAAVGVALFFGVGLIADFVAGWRKHRRERHQAEIEEAIEQGRPIDWGVKTEPSRFDRFFTAIGDFVIFLAQVVRVNKWKICPIVDIDRDARG